jgi:hypothetical protein
MTDNKTCSTCHWWFDGFNLPGISDRRPCVLHNGLKDEKVAKIEFGGNKTLRTSADFGCNQWESDKRNKP